MSYSTKIYNKTKLTEVNNMSYSTKIYKEEIPERTVSFDTSIAYAFDFVEAVLYNVVNYLQKHSKRNDNAAFFTRKSFQKWTGIGRHRFERAVATLQQAGLLETYTKGCMTFYKVLPFNEADFNENADKNKVKAEIKTLYYTNTDVSKAGGIIPAIVLRYIEMVAQTEQAKATYNMFQKTQKRLGKLLGMTRGQIQYALKKLKEKKLLHTAAKFVRGINKKATHFAALRICAKGVESLLKTLKFSTFVEHRFFGPKNKAENLQDQSRKTAGVKQKNYTPHINKLENKLSFLTERNKLQDKNNENTSENTGEYVYMCSDPLEFYILHGRYPDFGELAL